MIQDHSDHRISVSIFTRTSPTSIRIHSFDSVPSVPKTLILLSFKLSMTFLAIDCIYLLEVQCQLKYMTQRRDFLNQNIYSWLLIHLSNAHKSLICFEN